MVSIMSMGKKVITETRKNLVDRLTGDTGEDIDEAKQIKN
jgi:hypothetical protein